ncbi:MAG: methylmalonyl-CoA mutase family protein [Reichenbachiella sp.]|uniref:methylmalonyl-CoA mutase family protein n=1 Tax=Reichenbachiella sp. TaxID=2184521 RepID=UPI003296B1E4
MMKGYNFDEFAKSSKSQWLDKLKKDLGDENAQKILTWNCERDLILSSYYDKEDFSGNVAAPHANTDWKFLQILGTTSTNEKVLDGLMNGADGSILSDDHVTDINQLLATVKPQYSTLALCTSSFNSYEKLAHWWKSNNPTDKDGEVLVFHHIDDISQILNSDLLDFLDQSFEIGHKIGHRTININSGLVQCNGGSAAVELAYMLSQMVFYTNHFLNAGHKLEDITKGIFVSTSIGSSYFLELAKVRAMRLLLTQLFKQYGVENITIPIHAETSAITKTALDSNTNFLRCTSEAMSAVLGGVNYLSINPRHSLSSTDRIARNISNLLKEESYFAKISDPSAGSYYLENLTSELMKEAWGMFKQLESDGGFENAVNGNFFKDIIKRDFEFQRNRINSGRKKMVGVNDFGNQDETVTMDSLHQEHLSLASDFEMVRKAVESYVEKEGETSRPTVYLLGVGSNSKMINARFTFVTNFFNWAGFKIEKINPIQELNQKHILVCCGGDDDYTESNVDLALNGQKTQTLILGAGKEHAEASNQITNWVNARSNRLEVVRNILTQLGVTQNAPLS